MRADARKNFLHLLAVARAVVAEHGADTSLRDIARRARVGLATLCRRFPAREALFEALLRTTLDELPQKASELETTVSPDQALVSWFRAEVSFVQTYRGVEDLLATVVADPLSALHTSCVTVRAAGTRLLALAHAKDTAWSNIDGDDLFALMAASG